MRVNWSKLAEDVGDVNSRPQSLEVIASLLGKDFIEQAVEHTLSLEEGWQLSEGVLRVLAPLGMKHCYRIYKESDDLEKRRLAVFFLKYFGDGTVLDYIPEFLADPDEQIQSKVSELLDMLVFRGEIDFDDHVLPFRESLIEHSNESLRKFAIACIEEDRIPTQWPPQKE